MATKKSNINDFKDRMSSPVVGVRIDKNGKPLKSGKNRKSSKKK